MRMLTLMMITVLSVIGTRPEAIKMAPVVHELARRPGRFRSLVCATGQHRELLDQALALFGIAPDDDLDVMRPDQSLPGLTAALFTGLDRVFRDRRPDWVLAQGDTTTVFVAAMAAYYQRIPFGHVEAGLRSGDNERPFPEEVHRRVADTVAAACFAPTATACAALQREGIAADRIHLTGNTVVDAARAIAALPHDWTLGPLAHVPTDRRLVLVTAHRRESFGAPLVEILMAVRDLAALFAAEGVHFVVPVHPNPNVRQPLTAALTGIPNLSLLPPVDYRALIHLLQRCELVLTDSRGLQEEAPALGVPVLVLRATTERPEGVAAGFARLVGTCRERITAEAARLLSDPAARAAMTRGINPYGDGRAAARIVAVLNGDHPLEFQPR